MEESPSDSGLSDGTKTTHNDDIIESPVKHSAMIDLSKPLCKEEMLAIIQILRELWQKQFGSDMPDMQIMKSSRSQTQLNQPIRRPTTTTTMTQSYLSNNHKSQYHSTPALNKLSAELNDIKDKLKRFSKERSSLDEQPEIVPIEIKHIPQINGDNHLVFIPLGEPLTVKTK